MASSTRSGRTLKNEGSNLRSGNAAANVKSTNDFSDVGSLSPGSKNNVNSSAAKHTKDSGSFGSVAADSGSARKSSRETPTKKSRALTSSPKKSERLENQATPTPSDKKLESVEKKRPRSPLRRSERIEKNGISNSPGSRKINSSSPLAKKKKEEHENGTVEVTLTENQRKDKELDRKSSRISKKKKRLDAHRYRALLGPKKDESSDDGAMRSKDDSASKGNMSKLGSTDSKQVMEIADECSGRKKGKSLGEYSADNSKDAAEGSSSGSGELGETLSNLVQRKSARISEKKKNEDKSPVSKCSGSSLQSSSYGSTAKENGGSSSSRKSHVEVNMHGAQKSSMEGLDGFGSAASTSEEKSSAVGRSLECGVGLGDLKDKMAADRDSDVSVSAMHMDNCNPAISTTGVPPSTCGTKSESMKICTVCNKLERFHNVPNSKDYCLCDAPKEFDSLPSDVEDRGTLGVSDSMGVSEGHLSGTYLKESLVAVQTGNATNACAICRNPGQLLCCDGKGCKRNYHLSCLTTPLQDVPPGAWFCPFCVKKKVELGVHSISEGIESVWDVKEETQNGIHYFVKYKGLSHVHNRWIPESEILGEVPMLVAKFCRRYQKEKVTWWKHEWTEPCRLLQKRQLMYESGDDSSCCYHEWLVKWKGLGYEDATWELDNSPFLCSSEGIVLVCDFEARLEEARRRSDPSRADKAKKSPFHKLTKLPGDHPAGLDNDHLNSVNRLREFWHKSQNAIFIDDQERIIKSILFISALKSCTSHPILVVTTTTSLAIWESEFSRLAPSINVVVYSGAKHIRKMIHTLEFYEKSGCVMFQVLLSHPDVIIEDFEAVKLIHWESVVIDESQNVRVSKHLEQFRCLSTEFKLLLFSGQLKDNLAEHFNVLSFLDSGGKENHSSSSKYGTNESSGTLAILKEKLAHYLAYERKLDSSKFQEYWVPVRLSNVQLEQYCSTIISNSITLRSCQKTDHVGALREILISVRKCCDHPYLVGQFLQSSLTKDVPPDKILDIGIKASGKLHTLDKFLHEIKKQGLRVVILFQSIGGAGKDSFGDILDDFLRQKFGADSYERVDSGLVMSKKLAAMSMFNDKAKGRFVFLIENRACLPSIKLSSVDAVIVFNSDWNPLNDIRALQRIHIESQFDHVKVFRLYSSCTVEEKVLIFAKQDMILESNIQNITPSNSHLLLSWGAFHLFNQLDEFHQNDTGKSLLNVSMLKLLNDVMLELLKELPKEAEGSTGKCSLLIRAQQSGSSYSRNIILVGEKEGISSMDKDPLSFWSDLLERRCPKWRFISESSQRIRKKVQHFEGSSRVPEEENDELRKKRRKLSSSTVDPISLQTWLEDKTKGMGKDAKVLDDVSPTSIGQPARVSQMTISSNMPQESDLCGTQSNIRSESMPTSNGTMKHLTHNLHASSVPAASHGELHKFPMVESDEKRIEQRNLHLCLKPELSELCDTLKFPGEVKALAYKFLEYIMNNHHVSRDPESILQAFKLSLCWRAASFLKHKVDHRECLALARKYLNYTCNEDQAGSVYSKLRMLRKKFSQMSSLALEEGPNSLESQPPIVRHTQAARQVCEGTSKSVSSYLEELEIKGVSPSPRSSREVAIKQDQASVGDNPSEVQQDLGSLKDVLLQKQLHLVDMVCLKRADALLLKQQEELSDFNVQREEQKLMLKSAHDVQLDLIRSVHTDCTIRNDKVKLLNQDFSKKMAEFDKHMKCQRSKLAIMQEGARDKEHSIRDRWLAEAKAGTLAESFDTIPLTESRFRLEEFREVIGQVGASDGSRSILSAFEHASDLMSADMVPNVPEGSTTTSRKHIETSPTSNVGVEIVQTLIAQSASIAEVDPLQQDRTATEILSTVLPNMIEVESAELDEISPEIPDSMLPIAEVDPLQQDRTATEISSTVLPNMIEVESAEPDEISPEIPDSMLPAGDGNIVDNVTTFSESHIVNVLGDERDKTSEGAKTELPRYAEIPLDFVEQNGISAVVATFSPRGENDMSREMEIQPHQTDAENIVGNGSDEVLVDSARETTVATADRNLQDDEDYREGTCLISSSLQISPDLPSASHLSMNAGNENFAPNLVFSVGELERLLASGSGEVLNTSQGIAGLSESFGDDVTKQVEPHASCVSISNCTLVQVPPVDIISSENGQGTDNLLASAEDTRAEGTQFSGLPGLPIQQPTPGADGQSEQPNQLASHSATPSLTLAETSGTEGSLRIETNPQTGNLVEQPTLTADVPPAQSNQVAPQSAVPQVLQAQTVGTHGEPSSRGINSSISQTELLMQQLALPADVQVDRSNELSQQLLVHPLAPALQVEIAEGTHTRVCFSRPPTDLSVPQPIVSAIVQAEQSSELASEHVLHPLFPSANLLPETTRSEGLESTAVPQDPGRPSIQLFPLTHWVHPQALHPDPLQNELVRIQKQDEIRTKMHEDKKRQLRLECEQEMLKVRSKYDALLQDAESGFHQDKKLLETVYNKVLVNRILAAEFKSKFIDSRAGTSASVQGRSSNSTQQLVSTSQTAHTPRPTTSSMPQFLPTTQTAHTPRPSSSSAQQFLPTSQSSHSPRLSATTTPVPVQFSANLPPVSLTGSGSQFPASSSIASGPVIRHSPSHVRSQFRPVPPHQAGSDSRLSAPRAPAPHLHRFRPQTSIMPPISPLSTPSQLSSQQQHPQSNLGMSSAPATVAPLQSSRLPLSVLISQPFAESPRDVGAAIMGADLPMETLREVGSLRPSNRLLMGREVVTPTAGSARPATSTDVVCLSDDE